MSTTERYRAPLRGVLFDADAAQLGTSAYTDVVHRERVTTVDDPILGPARKVWRFEVFNTDVEPTSNPRAQLASKRVITAGMGVWMGWCTLFPTGFPDKLPAGQWPFVTLAEVYGPPYDGASPLRIAMRADTPALSVMTGFDVITDFGGPIQKDRWYDFALFQHMSEDPAVGYAELWVNTGTGWRRVLSHHLATLNAVNNQGPNYHKVACYRYANMYDVLTLYHGEHRIGHTFREVAPQSYGPPTI